MSSQQFGFEDVFTEIPNQLSSVEGVLNLEPDPFMKWLPHRHNRAIPNSVQEALADPRWKAAMNEEMKSLQKNETWELVESRLVAKGYTQTYGIDYTETFALVAKINTVQVLQSLTANLDWPLQQFDVKNAFLHVKLSEEVYMDLPPGSMVSEKQYHTLFLKKQHGKITALIVYVDDMVVIGNDPKERKAMQNYLSREFEMKDLGPLKYFLRIEGCQPVNTPIEEGLKLCVEPNQVSTDKERYQRLMGRLMYLAHTRPDLAYALSVVSQYMHNPGEQHMNAVMCILMYLKNAPGKGILFAKNVDHHSIEVYTDADWASAVDDRRSTSGYFTFATYLGKQSHCFVTIKLHAHDPVQHDRTKHVEVDRFFIKEKLDDKIVELPKIRS
ncbi:Retrovirus-related Pol polyprotein from transposon RE1 [Vitis vinifera]|uniref:Retrovirus-related Pol polyprotein from transposon RE1 n=1 Tax=Vitis vinifera TaxID=29760 RepID=A0A438CSF5_VITVI|nr:Retrovirus-related Pol polyprotein from transposon RE1 [Vitis vinifera]